MRKFSHYFCRERTGDGRAQSAAAVMVAEVRCGIGPVMGVVGYVLGTGAGLLCAFLMRAVYQML